MNQTKTINTTIKTSEGKFADCLATLMAQSAKYINLKIHNAREQKYSCAFFCAFCKWQKM